MVAAFPEALGRVDVAVSALLETVPCSSNSQYRTPHSPDRFNYYGTVSDSPRDLPHPETEDLVLTDVLFALSDPTRLAIVRELADGALEEMPCAAVGGTMPESTAPTSSRHCARPG